MNKGWSLAKVVPERKVLEADIHLPPAKSPLIRNLILRYLAGKASAPNPRWPQDVLDVCTALQSSSSTVHTGDGAAPFRFLMALFALEGRKVRIDGSSQMRLRPIGPLVDALREAGAKIKYLGRTGHPPVQLNGLDPGPAHRSTTVDIAMSSQYLSAIALAAISQPEGMTIIPRGDAVSRGYARMTLNALRHAGVAVDVTDGAIRISGRISQVPVANADADWSSAAYFILLASQIPFCTIRLPGLRLGSGQPDEGIADYAEQLGFELVADSQGDLEARWRRGNRLPVSIHLRDMPDLAPALVAWSQISGRRLHLTGLHHLPLKESNRGKILADSWALSGVKWQPHDGELHSIPNGVTSLEFNAEGDHRLVMAAAMCGLKHEVHVSDPSCVSKSFPDFWAQLRRLGLGVRMTTS